MNVVEHVKPLSQEVDGADLIIHFLEQIGVEYIFGIPGGAIEPLFNAMARSSRRGGIQPIVTRHEASAVFAADGYARQTGKLGVCCATTGPGATNLITGIANTYANHVPLLAITAQTALPTFGRGAFQESSCTGIDVVGMLQYCTRYNSLVSHVDQIQTKLISAIMTAMQSPRGPAHLSIPLDVMRATARPPHAHVNLERLLKEGGSSDFHALRELYKEISSCKRVAFVLGGGCGEAVGPILEVADYFNATIVTTPHGKGLVSADHPRYRGVIGFAGHDSARLALSESHADRVVAIETNLSEWASNGWDEDYLLNERLIHIDTSAENLTRSPMARLHVRGDIRVIFEQLLDIARTSSIKPENVYAAPVAISTSPLTEAEEAKYNSDAVPIKPQRLMHELNDVFPANARFFADTGNSVAWAIHYLQPVDRRSVKRRGANGGLLRTSIEFSSMGWAIGAAIGAATAYRDGPVVCITGDGSFLMHGFELSVAVAERLCVVFIILNDQALGMVKHGQRLGKAEPIAYELPEVNYAMMAEAMGANGYVINTVDDFRELNIQEICSYAGPTVLDVRIDGEEVPPMGVRIRTLGQRF